jgi:hypothetical protein
VKNIRPSSRSTTRDRLRRTVERWLVEWDQRQIRKWHQVHQDYLLRVSKQRHPAAGRSQGNGR